MMPGGIDWLLRGCQNSYPQCQTAPDEVAEKYDDGQLYRILVAQALTDSLVESKDQFDARIRGLGSSRAAEELIAFRKLRPECKAWRHGKIMVCDCGTSWVIDDPLPPKCKGYSK